MSYREKIKFQFHSTYSSFFAFTQFFVQNKVLRVGGDRRGEEGGEKKRRGSSRVVVTANHRDGHTYFQKREKDCSLN